jgi:cyclopropane fatty-acyl-phospholipid synthase-like methyltransferase
MIRNGNVERNYPSRDNGTAEGVCADHIIRYELASKYTEGKRVLDSSSGVGYGSTILKAANYVGYDISEEAINYGLTYFAKPTVSFELKDLDLLSSFPVNPEDRFDVLVSFETIEHLKDPERFLGWTLLMADTVLVSTPIAFPGKNGKHSEYHTIEWYCQEFMDICQSKVDNYNSMFSDKYKITYRWEFDDGLPYIQDLNTNPLPTSGVIIAIFEKY